eukprot:Nitzschia sp. Nitz4//scaffold87_size112219//107484//108674//NITZ4_004093-RA/size112219-processed-gene-0.119-mRNA-1//1//CDS//3329559426//8725//frame0
MDTTTENSADIVLVVPPGKIGLILSMDERNGGAMITKVQPTSPFREQLQTGDRIVTVDGKSVVSLSDFQVNTDQERKFGIAKVQASSDLATASTTTTMTSSEVPVVEGATTAATPPEPPSTMKKTAAPAEKRLRRFRSSPTIKIQERIGRALHQRLFLIEASPPSTCPKNGGPSITLSVLGSTGNVYDVSIQKVPKCSCPDAARGNLCKHLLFVMLKVVGLPADHSLVYQSAYITQELEEIHSMLQERLQRLGRDVMAKEEVQQVYADRKKGIVASSSSQSEEEDSQGVRRKEVEEEDCPICFDLLGSNLSLLTYCRGTCGTNFHKGCIQMWTKQSRQHPTCPACRQPWEDPETGGKSKNGKIGKESYENLGHLQGQSAKRDTSTYNRGGYKRRRY